MPRHGEIILAGVVFLLAAASALFWLPNDVETGLFHTHRRQTYIGDSLIPAICVAGILVVSLVHFATNWFTKADGAKSSQSIDPAYVIFCLSILGVLIAGCVIMFWAGPLAVQFFGPTAESGEAEVTYRQLRGTMPWNLIGYFLGANAILLGLSVLIEGRLRLVRVVSSVVVVSLLILLLQGTIDGLLLPPNGDW